MKIKTSFVDGDRQKQLAGGWGEEVISSVELFAKKEKAHIIIDVLPPFDEEIRLILVENGYREQSMKN